MNLSTTTKESSFNSPWDGSCYFHFIRYVSDMKLKFSFANVQ